MAATSTEPTSSGDASQQNVGRIDHDRASRAAIRMVIGQPEQGHRVSLAGMHRWSGRPITRPVKPRPAAFASLSSRRAASS